MSSSPERERNVADATTASPLEEQELWAHVTHLWALARARDRKRIAAGLHPDYVGWDMSSAGTHDATAAVSAVCDAGPELETYALRPLSVKVYAGHTGVVHYTYEATVVANGSSRSEVTGGWTEVYVRDGLRWLMVAVSGRPQTA